MRDLLVELKDGLKFLLLQESLSISDNVIEYTNIIIDMIRDKCNKGEFENKRKVILNDKENGTARFSYCSSFTIKPDEHLESLIPNIYSISINVVDFLSKEEIKANFEEQNIGGDFIATYNTIKLKLPSINGEIVDYMLRNSICHELEHAYQLAMARRYKSDKHYNIALDNLDNNDPVLIAISRLIYFFNPMEIDAKMHELYLELKWTEYNKALPIEERDYYINTFYNQLKSIEKEKLNDVLSKFFSIDYETFFKKIDRNIKYFNSKAIRVYWKYIKDNDINEIVEMPKWAPVR